ncbi:hypothetical protein M1466_02885 [Candidatus Dependentiae bacterium]|nr:hypothetical protein [Candidatus Dependentiae bacterium]
MVRCWAIAWLIAMSVPVSFTASPFVIAPSSRKRQTVSQLQEAIARHCAHALQQYAASLGYLARQKPSTALLQEIAAIAEAQQALITVVQQLAEGDATCPLTTCDKQHLVAAERSFALFADTLTQYTVAQQRHKKTTTTAMALQEKLCAILQEVAIKLPKVHHGKL